MADVALSGTQKTEVRSLKASKPTYPRVPYNTPREPGVERGQRVVPLPEGETVVVVVEKTFKTGGRLTGPRSGVWSAIPP